MDMAKPIIRFKGYQDDWEQRKLGDVAQEFKSGTSLKADEIDITGDYPVYGGNGLRGYTSTYNHDGEYALIGRQGALCGNMNYSVGKAYFTEHAVVVKADENNDTMFLYYMLDTMNLGQYSDQSAQPGLAVNKLVKLENWFPTKEEQQRIGWYFSNLDHLITLHQRKCDETKRLKKYLLQKMFPQNGEKVPEIRFSGFTDDWEQRKVSELCSISTGKSNTQDKVEDGEYPFYVRSPIIERSTKYLYDEEAVITVGDGVGTGKVFHYVNGKYDLHQRCYRMYGFSDELNAHYFYHTFSKLFYKRVMAMTAKTSVDSVRLEMISDMKIPVPNVEEQRKIGNLLDGIDNLITLHQRELENFQNIKRFMLGKMFV